MKGLRIGTVNCAGLKVCSRMFMCRATMTVLYLQAHDISIFPESIAKGSSGKSVEH